MDVAKHAVRWNAGGLIRSHFAALKRNVRLLTAAGARLAMFSEYAFRWWGKTRFSIRFVFSRSPRNRHPNVPSADLSAKFRCIPNRRKDNGLGFAQRKSFSVRPTISAARRLHPLTAGCLSLTLQLHFSLGKHNALWRVVLLHANS